jgi:ubiquinone/menaquinone biosynthesis C-methylase UbiE
MIIDWRAAKVTQRRYDRQALWYDLNDVPMELFARRLRRRLWGKVDGGRVLEVGVGTGRNLPYHPPQSGVTAIDISPKLLAKAARKARKKG